MKIYFLLCLNLVKALELYDKADSGYKACGLLYQTYTSGLSRSVNVSAYCDVGNQPMLGSMALCLVDNFEEKYLKQFISKCHSQLTTADFDRSYENASVYSVNSSQSASEQYRPLYFTKAEVAQKALDVYNQDRTNNFSVIYGTILTAYWFFICAVAGIIHWSKMLFPIVSQRALASVPINYIRRFIVLPATIKKAHFHTKKLGPLEWFVPLRMETLLLSIYFILSAIFCGVEINSTASPAFTQVGNRSGILTTFAMPVLVLFAGRNNFLQAVSGWQYTRFILFHRWIARVTFLLLMVHVGTKTMTLKYYNSYPGSLKSAYLLWGVVSTVAMGLLVGCSMLWLRRRRYELFLITHYIFAILMIAGGWVHVRIAQLEGFFIACVAIWGLNILIRAARLTLFGIQDAFIELKADETVRVICKRPKWWVPHPGSHAFVHFLTPTGFWQSHPFTLVDEPEEEHTIGMYAKIKGGITHGLYQRLLQSPEHKARIRVMVEGPYFERMPVDQMDRSVFIASGNGIPGMYAGARDMAMKNPKKHVKLIWVIREYTSLCWFFRELKQLDLLNIEIIIYVTRGSNGDRLSHSIEPPSLSDISEKSNPISRVGSITLVSELKLSLEFIEFIEGRPNIQSLLSDEVVCAGNQSNGVVTCGHPVMVDDIRQQVVKLLVEDPSRKIELFEQFQMW